MANRNSKAAVRGLRTYAALLALALGTAAAAGARLAFADEGGARKCLGLSEIDSTQIVDDGTILFRMRNGDIYRNVLPRECPTLKDRDQFSYRLTTARLCSTDVITVLEERGFALASGASCSLGSFEPISAGDAQSLIDSAPN